MKTDWATSVPPSRTTGDTPTLGVAGDMNDVRAALIEIRSNVPNSPGDIGAEVAGGGGGGSALGIFDITAYGAVGNNSTDCTTAINNAEAARAAAGRGVVYFPSGRYVTNGGHVIGSFANWRGEEMTPQYWVYNGSAMPDSACALVLKSGTTQTAMIKTTSSSKAFSIVGLTLLGSNTGTSKHGIEFAAPSSEQAAVLNNVAIIGFTGQGITGGVQASRFDQLFISGCGGYGMNCSGTFQWADLFMSQSFITGNKLGGLNIDSTGSNGLLNFEQVRFERSGWNPNTPGTPTATGGPGIRIRGNLKKSSFVSCSTDANSGNGLDFDRTAGRELHDINFIDCWFCRDGFGSMSAIGEYAGAKVRGTSGNTADYVNFVACHVEAGKADDGGGLPSYTHPKYGIWFEYTTFVCWAGGRVDAGVTPIYGGPSGWSSNYKPSLAIPDQNAQTMPYWSTNAERPTPVTDGTFGINGSLGSGAGKMEFYWGGWHTVTSS